MGHVVLLGDSIFDNAPYVPAGETVSDHLKQLLPADTELTLLAVDGSITTDIHDQIKQLPETATHLILSVGGNDALNIRHRINNDPANSFLDALRRLGALQSDFQNDYQELLQSLHSLDLPLTVCTIYTQIPGLSRGEVTGLSLFNDVITLEAARVQAQVIDLRLFCTSPADYSPVSPIEPSSQGGKKIAEEISRRVSE